MEKLSLIELVKSRSVYFNAHVPLPTLGKSLNIFIDLEQKTAHGPLNGLNALCSHNALLPYSLEVPLSKTSSLIQTTGFQRFGHFPCFEC